MKKKEDCMLTKGNCLWYNYIIEPPYESKSASPFVIGMHFLVYLNLRSEALSAEDAAQISDLRLRKKLFVALRHK